MCPNSNEGFKYKTLKAYVTQYYKVNNKLSKKMLTIESLISFLHRHLDIIKCACTTTTTTTKRVIGIPESCNTINFTLLCYQ